MDKTGFESAEIVEKYTTSILPRKLIGFPALMNLIGSPSGRKFIDIGCGAGEICGALHIAGASVYGIDTSDEFLKKAKEQYAHISFDKIDACNMSSIQSSSFDGATMFMVTFSITNRESLGGLFAETARVLKSGGNLFYGTIHPLMIDNLQSPIVRVNLPEGKGYLNSEITITSEVMLADGNWIKFIDHHWKLEDVVSEMVAHGLAITGISEPGLKSDKAQDPKLECLARRPFYLLLKATKLV